MTTPPDTFNLINTEDIDLYIKQFCDNDPQIEVWVCASLSRIFRRNYKVIEEVTVLPENAPEWLVQKWDSGGPWHRFAPKKGTGYPHWITEIAEWVQYAIACDEPWIHELNPKGIPFKLLSFSSLDEAIEEKKKDVARISARLRREARLRLPHDDQGDTRQIMIFDDGFKIVRLVAERALDRESAFLEHCIGDGQYDDDLFGTNIFFYSLRDEEDIPCATMSVDSKDHWILQIAGRRNVFPEKYYDYLASFCHEFELDLVTYMRRSADYYEISDTYEFGLYPALWKKKTQIERPSLTFERDDPINLQDNMHLSYLKIADMGGLKIFPKNLTVSGSLILLGGPLPEQAPVNLKVSGAITTTTDEFESVTAFIEKNYDQNGVRRPPLKINLSFKRQT